MPQRTAPLDHGEQRLILASRGCRLARPCATGSHWTGIRSAARKVDRVPWRERDLIRVSRRQGDVVTVKRSDQVPCPRCGSIGFCLPLADDDSHSVQCLKCGAVSMYSRLIPTPTHDATNHHTQPEDAD